MTKVISVNSGSSSLKFQLFEMPQETVLTSGQAERIGQEMGQFTIKVNGEKHVSQTPIPDHQKAVDLLLQALVDYKIVDSLDEIKGAGHRVVQGGSLAGSGDSHTIEKRLSGKPSQTVCVCNSDGIECVYPVML